MDERRYDRNADQLSQIYHHFNNLKTLGAQAADIAEPMRQEMGQLLERALVLNDMMGRLKEMGLI